MFVNGNHLTAAGPGSDTAVQVLLEPKLIILNKLLLLF